MENPVHGSDCVPAGLEKGPRKCHVTSNACVQDVWDVFRKLKTAGSCMKKKKVVYVLDVCL